MKKNIEDSTKKLRIVEHLQELGQEAEYLALWLDCDREGENIGFEVISLVSQWIPYDSVYRANFSALTNAELSHTYNNLGHPDKYQAMSVDARQELDLKIGVAFSRLMTRTYLQMATEKFRLRDQKVRFTFDSYFLLLVVYFFGFKGIWFFKAKVQLRVQTCFNAYDVTPKTSYFGNANCAIGTADRYATLVT